jgi:small subunit ribosomal protein S6
MQVAINPQGAFMRHYEIVLVVHPDQTEQVGAMVERYKNTVTASNGVIHRYEDWGRRQLAYSINNVNKGHYVCINIEAEVAIVQELEHSFKFNDAILRYIVIKTKTAETGISPMLKELQKEEGRKASSANAPAANTNANASV